MGNEMEAARKAPGGHKKVIFAFEEAIGFACGDTVRDKDGVSAAAVFAQMAYGLRARGLTIAQRLGQLFAKYGLHLSRNHYLFVDEPAKTNAIFARLRNEGHYWKRIGGGASGGAPVNITAIRDLTSPGWDSEAADGKPTLPTSGGSHMITYKVRRRECLAGDAAVAHREGAQTESAAAALMFLSNQRPSHHSFSLPHLPTAAAALTVLQRRGGHAAHQRYRAQAQVLHRDQGRCKCA